jgi:LPS export ABC transporter protein LptC
VVGCGVQPPSQVIESRTAGLRLSGVQVREEREGKLSFSLSARSGQAASISEDLSLASVAVRFGGEKDAQNVNLRAEQAVLRRDGKRVDFSGKVEAEDGDKRTFRADRAIYRPAKHTLEIPVPLVTDSAKETLRADRAIFDFNEESLVLEGRVKAVVRQ